MSTARTNGQFTTSPPEAAAYYLSRNLAPVPLLGRTKQVTFAGWPNYRADPNDLGRFAGNNIGLLLGVPSNGIVDTDLDCPEAIAAADVLLPCTGMVFGRKSAPRSHRLYVCPTEPKFLALADPVASDDRKRMLVELRNTGKQTMCPPSLHPDTGERVEWSRLEQPHELPAADLERAVKAVAAAALLGRYWPKGVRHHASLALAGGLLRAWDGDVERVKNFVSAVLLAAGDDEVSDRMKAVEDTAESLTAGQKDVSGWPKLVEHLGQGQVVIDRVTEWLGVDDAQRPGWSADASSSQKRWDRGGRPTRTSGMSGAGCGRKTPYTPIPPDVPFPVDILPGPWAEFVREGARVLKCDTGLVALPALGVIASAVGMTRRICLNSEWYEPAVFWVCPILESGGMKTPAAELSVGLVKDIQKKHLAAHRAEMEQYTEELACFRRAQRGRRGRDAADALEVDEPKRPLLKRVLVGDVTIEKLAGMLDDNPRGLLKYSDELAAHFGSFTRYKSGGGSDEANWLSMFRADAIVYDRKTGEKPSVFVPHAAVSVVGGIQPGVLKKLLTKGLFDSGTVARFVFRLAVRTPKEYVEEGIDPELKARVTKSLQTLFALEPDTDDDGLPRPKVVTLGDDARRRWKRFINEWGERQFNTDGELAAALSKLEAMAARFALIHHLVSCDEWADEAPVRLASIEAGIRFVEWAANEAVRVYRTLNESDDTTELRKLVDLVRRLAAKSPTKDRLTPAVLQRSRKEKYPTAEAAEAALDSLVSAGIGHWEEGTGKPGQGGRVSRLFVLNPIPDLPNLDDESDDDASGDGPDLPPDEPPSGCSGSDESSNTSCDQTGDYAGSPAEDADSKLGKSGVGSWSTSAEHTATTPSPPVSKLGEQVGSAYGTSAFGVGGPAPLLVTDDGTLEQAWNAVGQSDRVGLDLETTGLDPRTDRIRLLSLATEVGTFLVDCFSIDPKPLFKVLGNVELVGHNLAFDLGFLVRLGFTPGRVSDTMLGSQVLDAGTMPPLRHGLADAAERHLGLKLSKEERLSDWSGILTPAQLKYAADDVTTTVRLAGTLGSKLKTDKLAPVIELENRTLPGVVWMSSAGVGFDRPAWEKLAVEAEAEVARLTGVLDGLVPGKKNLFGADGRNWNSPEQVKAVFNAHGIELESTDDATLAGLDHPLAATLRDYRAAAKLIGTYGRAWLEHVAPDGRVYAGWKQIGAERTGRMSCKEPNLQQLPRDPRYRRCFVAPPGRVLVKADYSQIELRLAAKISGDAVMLAAYQAGKDLHAETAKAVLGKAEVTKADRQLAKALNFGLLYGMGAKGFAEYAKNQYGVTLKVGEAESHRNKFFRTYPGLKRWHQRTTRDTPIHTFTVLGRRRKSVDKFTQQLNSPVQGSGGDGVKAALALLWERRLDCPGAVPVLAVHDEIVVECDADKADVAKAWLTSAMVDGMTPFADPVPVVVDVSVSATWGGDALFHNFG